MADQPNHQSSGNPDRPVGGTEESAPKGRGKFAQMLSYLVTAPDAPQASAQADADASMSIRLEPGELAGAVQFIASARRSGTLALYRADTGEEAGSVSLQEGRIIHAQQADGSIGVEAVAGLMAEGAMDSQFIEGRVSAVTSLEHSADQLLLEAAVMADEKLEAGGGEGGGRGRVSRNRGSGRHVSVLRIGISVATFALLLWICGSLTPRLWRQWQEKRTRQRQIQELAETHRARVEVLMRQARAAYTRRRYNVSIELCQDALDLDRKSEEAARLLKRAQSAHTAGDARHARGKVQMVQQNLDDMQASEIMPEEHRELQQHKETARRLMALDEFRGATEAYESAMAHGKRLLTALERRRLALTHRQEADAARRRAREAGAPTAAHPLWEAGTETFAQAEGDFGGDRFVQAGEAWRDAAAIFDDAVNVSFGQRELEAAERTYQDVRRSIEGDLLADFGGSLWEQVRQLRSKVEALRADHKFRAAAELVDEARSLLPAAVEQAEALRRATRFRELMTEGERLEAVSKWRAAETTYAEALKVPGFGESVWALEAKSRMTEKLAEERRQQDLAKRLRQAREADEAQRWHDVLAETDAALALDEGNPEAVRLQQKALTNLPPLLTVRTRVDGQELKGAEIFIDGVQQRRRSPCQFAVETRTRYRIAARMPADHETPVGGGMDVWSTEEPGRYTLWVDLATDVVPAQGKSFSLSRTWIAMRPVAPGSYARSFGEGQGGICEVRIDTPFWMASVETTRLARGTILEDKTAPRTHAFLPVVSVNWFEAVRIAQTLTKRERQAGRLPEGYVYRLPTEAEWELACRAGWEGDPPLGETAWYAYNSDGEVHPVGRRKPNLLGLYDVLGNASELCLDWVSPGPNPDVPPPEDQRARRGGSARSEPAECTPNNREPASDQSAGLVHGFRLVLAPEKPGKQYHWGQGRQSAQPEPGVAWRLDALNCTFVPLEDGGGRAFWVACHETTQAQYRKITDVSAGHFEGANRPVESVTWEQASRFCKHLTEREQMSNRLPLDMAYRLPTLREWMIIREAATPPAEVPERKGTHPISPVDRRAPVLQGVFDNVQEWCLDWRDREGCGMARSGRGLHEEACTAAAGRAWFDVRGGKDDLAIYGSRFAAPFIGFRIVLGRAPVAESLLCDRRIEGPGWTSALESMEMVFVMPGRFKMGRADGEQREAPPHDVLITHPFWMGRREVTEGQYGRVMERDDQKGREPVGSLTWNDAMAYCRRLTEAERANGSLPSGYAYRLPTEAEWEYVARQAAPAGPLSQYAWYKDNSRGAIHAVALKEADALGLYDLRGNVWEWCYDWYASYDKAPERDPWGAVVGSHKVYRGGGAGAPDHMCSPSYRVAMSQYFRNKEVGFRVVLAPQINAPENPKAGAE